MLSVVRWWEIIYFFLFPVKYVPCSIQIRLKSICYRHIHWHVTVNRNTKSLSRFLNTLYNSMVVRDRHFQFWVYNSETSRRVDKTWITVTACVTSGLQALEVDKGRSLRRSKWAVTRHVIYIALILELSWCKYRLFKVSDNNRNTGGADRDRQKVFLGIQL